MADLSGVSILLHMFLFVSPSADFCHDNSCFGAMVRALTGLWRLFSGYHARLKFKYLIALSRCGAVGMLVAGVCRTYYSPELLRMIRMLLSKTVYR